MLPSCCLPVWSEGEGVYNNNSFAGCTSNTSVNHNNNKKGKHNKNDSTNMAAQGLGANVRSERMFYDIMRDPQLVLNSKLPH